MLARMSTSTARYRFEFRLFDWAETLSRGLCGSRTSYFVGLRDDASVRRIYFASDGMQFDGEQKTQLAATYTRWFLYTPYEDPGTGCLEWYGLERATAERWLARAFEPVDFLDVRATGTRDEWPTNWRVVVR